MDWILFELRIAIIDKGNLIFIISNKYKWPNFILVTNNHYRWRKFNFASQWQLSMDRILFELWVIIIDEGNLIFVISNQYNWSNSVLVTNNHYRWRKFNFASQWQLSMDWILFELRITIINNGNLIFPVSNQCKWPNFILVILSY